MSEKDKGDGKEKPNPTKEVNAPPIPTKLIRNDNGVLNVKVPKK